MMNKMQLPIHAVIYPKNMAIRTQLLADSIGSGELYGVTFASSWMVDLEDLWEKKIEITVTKCSAMQGMQQSSPMLIGLNKG